MTGITYRTADVDGFNVFYREAGPAGAPKLLLLHGFPSSSHMFRDLIPLLADRFHIVAPDLPGLRPVRHAAREQFKYTFDNIANVIDRFTEMVGFDRFARLRVRLRRTDGFAARGKHPERITAIISQNGNAYEEGLSEGGTRSGPIGRTRPQANREALRGFLTPETTRWQYTHGVPDPRLSLAGRLHRSTTSTCPAPAPTKCNSTCSATTRATSRSIPLPGLFPHPQAAVAGGMGQERPVLPSAGRRGVQAATFPDAEIRFFDTGHFALETHATEIAAAIGEFLSHDRSLAKG